MKYLFIGYVLCWIIGLSGLAVVATHFIQKFW